MSRKPESNKTLAAPQRTINNLDHVERIRQLKYRYCEFCDNDYDPDGIASLFADDAVRDGGASGRTQGRAGIRSFLVASPAAIKFAIHQVANQIIEVDGDTATHRWYLWQPKVMQKNDQALWLEEKYVDQYVPLAERWRRSRRCHGAAAVTMRAYALASAMNTIQYRVQ